MKHFGPILLEAFVCMLLDEINILRDEQGMPPTNIGNLFDSITNHMSSLTLYDWMIDQQ